MPAHPASPLFTLVPHRWYALQLFGTEFVPETSSNYSPIRINSVTPMKTGKDILKLDFFHENYPEGVQDKVYTVRVVARDPTFVFAKSTEHKPARHLLITEITWAWLGMHFGIHPRNPGDDVQLRR